jgi:hypothetical protein
MMPRLTVYIRDKGRLFDSRAQRIFHDLRKVSEYKIMELVGGRELWLSILRWEEPVLRNVA